MLLGLFLSEFSVVLAHGIWRKDYVNLLDILKDMAKLKYRTLRRGLLLVVHIPGHMDDAAVQEK